MIQNKSKNKINNYQLIIKDRRKNVKGKFQLEIWNNILNKCESVKYLGLYIDQNINWKTHITHASYQIAKSTGIFYRLKHLVDHPT